MKITWMTQGSFLFETGGTRILADPYMSDCLEAQGVKRMVAYPLSFQELSPDMLICTHDHLDHLDPETVEKIATLYPDCLMAGPASCFNHFKQLGVDEKRCRLMLCGNTFEFKGVKITPVPAYHSDPEAVGIILEAEGKKIYLTGDSLYGELLFNEFTANCDLVLICINGRLGNMSIEEALQVVKKLKPASALPMHYGLFAENTADPESFILGCHEAGIKSWNMDVGQAYLFATKMRQKHKRKE